jgi:Tfp pilus assembly protein PilP
VHNGSIVASAEAAPAGPVVAIEKANAAAAAESRRGHESDAEAARIFAPPGDPAAPTGDTAKVNDVASRTPADTAAKITSGTDPDAAKRLSAAADAAGPSASSDGQTHYDPAHHRDPFRAPNVTETVSEKAGPRTPLEGYELGQLRLVGIVKDAGNARAMVEDSVGLGYIVTTGTPIGSSGGVVRSIERRRMVIQETTTNFYGEKQAKEVVMELPQEDRSP